MSRIFGLTWFVEKSPSSSIFKVRLATHGVESFGKFSEVMGIVCGNAATPSHYISPTRVNAVVFELLFPAKSF